MIKVASITLGIILTAAVFYSVLVSARIVCEDFGPLDDDTIIVRAGIAYSMSTNVPFSGVVHDSGCGRECESTFLCPDPPLIITYKNGIVVGRVTRWLC